VTGGASVPFPGGEVAGPDDLDARWLTEALRHAGVLAPSASVARVESAPVAQAGFASQVVRLQVSYDPPGAAAATFVAKLPAANPQIRGLMAGQGAYEREARFYADVAPRVPLRLPECIVQAPATGGPLLLLEDLAPAKRGDQLAGFEAAEAATVLEHLARFHAATREKAGEADAAKLDPFPRFDQGLDVAGLYRAAWEPFRENFGDRLPAWLLRHGAPFADRIDELRGRLAKHPRSLVHGDLRLENLYFGPPPPGLEVAILDWQSVTRGRGTFDVAYLLAGNLRNYTRDLVTELFDGYHQQLARHAGGDGDAGDDGDDDPDRRFEDFRRATLFLLARTVITGARPDFAQGEARKRFEVVLDRGLTAFAELEVEEFLVG